MGYLKQDEVKRKAKRGRSKRTEKPEPVSVVVTGPEIAIHTPTPSLQHDINHVAGLSGIEASLDWIARGLSCLTGYEQTVSISAGYQPFKVTLAENDEDDALSRLITAIERIADSLAKLAGLSRPRLENWHEQDEYEPRYKNIACDGGAPGPSRRVGGHSETEINETAGSLASHATQGGGRSKS